MVPHLLQKSRTKSEGSERNADEERKYNDVRYLLNLKKKHTDSLLDQGGVKFSDLKAVVLQKVPSSGQASQRHISNTTKIIFL